MEQHNTYIDIGNTRIKVARYDEKSSHTQDEWEMIASWDRYDADAVSEASELLRREDRVFGVSVVDSLTNAFEERIPNQIHWVTSNQIPLKRSKYLEISSLGTDRFLLVDAAWRESEKERNIVVIGAGTACTIDLMDRSGVHLGGAILPGIIPLQRSYEICMPALPQVESVLPEQWPGMSTSEAIQWGQTGLYQAAILNFLRKTASVFTSFDLYLTGGDASLIEKLLKHAEHQEISLMKEFSIETLKVDPWLLFKGLKVVDEWR